MLECISTPFLFVLCIEEWIQISTHLFQNYPQFTVIHTVKSFGMVNKEEIDVFLFIRWRAGGLLPPFACCE